MSQAKADEDFYRQQNGFAASQSKRELEFNLSKASPIKKTTNYSENKYAGAGSSSVNLEKAYEELERDILDIKKKL